MLKHDAWTVAEAQNRLKELLDTVDEDGPQEIEHQGKIYRVSAQPPPAEKKNRLVEIITSGPCWDDIETGGIPGTMRDIEL